MAKLYYRYNPSTCQFELIRYSGKQHFKRFIAFVSVCLLLATGCFTWYILGFPSIEERLLQNKNDRLNARWEQLDRSVDRAYSDLSNLIEKDDKQYRVLLDLPPLSPEQREAGFGGSLKAYMTELVGFPLILGGYEKIEKLKQVIRGRKTFDQPIGHDCGRQNIDNRLTGRHCYVAAKHWTNRLRHDCGAHGYVAPAKVFFSAKAFFRL